MLRIFYTKFRNSFFIFMNAGITSRKWKKQKKKKHPLSAGRAPLDTAVGRLNKTLPHQLCIYVILSSFFSVFLSFLSYFTWNQNFISTINALYEDIMTCIIKCTNRMLIFWIVIAFTCNETSGLFVYGKCLCTVTF